MALRPIRKAYEMLDETKINMVYNEAQFSDAVVQLIYDTLTKCNNIEKNINTIIKPEMRSYASLINIEVKRVEINSSVKDKKDAIILPIISAFKRFNGTISIQGYECVSCQDYKTKVLVPWKDGNCVISIYFIRTRF
jgi:hypothetical protein